MSTYGSLLFTAAMIGRKRRERAHQQEIQRLRRQIEWQRYTPPTMLWSATPPPPTTAERKAAKRAQRRYQRTA